MHRVRGRSVALCLILAIATGTTAIDSGPAAAGPTITSVGTFATADAVGLTTLADNPQTAGDVLEVFAMAPITTVTLSSISGGGVSTWTKAVQFDGTIGSDVEIWYGTVTTTGSSTITFTWSGSVSSHTMEYGAQEFTAGLGSSTVWSVDHTGTTNGSSSTTVPFPSLTPSGSGELYFGYSVVYNTASAGSTSGFTYPETAESNVAAYNPNVSGAVSPTAAQSPAGISSSAATLMIASSSSATPTVTGVSPSSGFTTGDTSVGITGTNFTGATQVRFGDVPATSLTVNSATSITATSPPEASGTVDVSVATPGGTSVPNPPSDQFTFVTIAAVGSLASSHGTAITTLAVNPLHVQDLVMVGIMGQTAATTGDVSGLSGGGVSSWTKVQQYYGATGNDVEVWYGIVATAGSSTITFSWSGTLAGHTVEYNAQEFTASFGYATIWAADTSGTHDSPSSTTVTLPSLTPSVSGELYFGFAVPNNTGSSGSTSGFTYGITSDANVVAYDANVSGAVSPTANQSPAAVSGSAAVLIRIWNALSSGTPTITGVSPNSGAATGGTSITITGTNFVGDFIIYFGSVEAYGWTPISSTQVSVTTPASAVGTVDITIISDGGTSATSSADHFTFTIAPVGTFATADAVGLTTLADNPQTAGDVLEVFAMAPITTVTLSSISGGGVSTWTKAVQFDGTIGSDVEIWYGTVTTTGSSTITFTWSGSVSSHTMEYGAQEFTAGLGSSTVWSVDHTGTTNGSSSTTVPFPSLTPSGSGELYFGYSVVYNTASAGSTSGFTYPETAESNVAAYNPNVSGAVSPTAAQSPAGISSSAATLMIASPPVPTVTAVSPNVGPTTGATSVTVTGTAFNGATAVKFGSTSATAFTVNGPTSITATSPAETQATVDITVTTPMGTSSTSSADQFIYAVAPGAATAVTAVLAASSANVTWTAPASTGGTPVTSYTVVTSGGGPQVTVPSTSALITGLNLASSYSFVVYATNAVGTGPASAASNVVGPGTVPGQPAEGYRMVDNVGGVYAYGDAGFYNSLPGLGIHVSNIVGMAGTPDGGGYWLVGADGGIYTFGDAGFYNSLPGLGIHVSNIVGMAGTPSGHGYWLVGADGGVFAFGDAGFHGSLPPTVPAKPIVGMADTPDGGGYWLVGADGGIFSYGDAVFHGSLPPTVPFAPIVGMAATGDGGGYWLVGADGGIFTYGDAPFLGSSGGISIGDITGIAATPDSAGYWITGADSAIYGFGDGGYLGSDALPGVVLSGSVVGISMPT